MQKFIVDLCALLILAWSLLALGSSCSRRGQTGNDPGEEATISYPYESLDSAEGDEPYGVVYGNVIPLQVCDKAFGQCTALANGVAAGAVTDAIGLSAPPDSAAPAIADVAYAQGNNVVCVNMTTRAVRGTVNLGAKVNDIEESEDGQYVVAGTDAGVSVISCTQPREIRETEISGGATSVCNASNSEEVKWFFGGETVGAVTSTNYTSTAHVDFIPNISGDVTCNADRLIVSSGDPDKVLEFSTEVGFPVVKNRLWPFASHCQIAPDADNIVCLQDDGDHVDVVSRRWSDDSVRGLGHLTGKQRLKAAFSRSGRKIVVNVGDGATDRVYDCTRSITCTQHSAPGADRRGAFYLPRGGAF